MRETAKLLGVCLDTVRRHLRAGQIPGRRAGRDWRVPERAVLAKMGLVDSDKDAKDWDAADEEKLVRPEGAVRVQALVAAGVGAGLPGSDAGVQAEAARKQIRALVQQAAHHADLSWRNTQRLLAELDDLLQT